MSLRDLTPPDADVVIAVDYLDHSSDATDGVTIGVTGDPDDVPTGASWGGEYSFTFTPNGLQDAEDVVDAFVRAMRYTQYGDADGVRIFRPHSTALKFADVRAADDRAGALPRQVADMIRDRLRGGEAGL